MAARKRARNEASLSVTTAARPRPVNLDDGPTREKSITPSIIAVEDDLIRKAVICVYLVEVTCTRSGQYLIPRPGWRIGRHMRLTSVRLATSGPLECFQSVNIASNQLLNQLNLNSACRVSRALLARARASWKSCWIKDVSGPQSGISKGISPGVARVFHEGFATMEVCMASASGKSETYIAKIRRLPVIMVAGVFWHQLGGKC